MSTLIILLDQTSNANDVDIMVIEPCVLFPPAAAWGDTTHCPLFVFIWRGVYKLKLNKA